MRRALIEAIESLERLEEARESMRPTLILSPGQAAPKDWDGEVIQIRITDGRKSKEES